MGCVSVCTVSSTVTVYCACGLTVYLSLGSTNITTNNTEILITDIGEDGLPSLTCHTDLTACCRARETGTEGMGEWYYPDGRIVPNQAAGEGFYRVRNAPQVIRLARRVGITPAFSPTGSYCCVIPTTGGEMTFCANIGEYIHSVQFYIIHYRYYIHTAHACIQYLSIFLLPLVDYQ